MQTEEKNTQLPDREEIDVPQELYAMRKKGNLVKVMFLLLAILLVLSVSAVLLTWQLNVFTLELTMAGQAEMTLEHGTVFEDPGAQAYFSGTLLGTKPEVVSVQVTGAVDTSKVGTYQLTYDAAYTVKNLFGTEEYSQTRTRTVHIVDTQAPVITLTTDPDYFTLPGGTYVEEGFTAIDNADGDLTAKTVRWEADDKVHYRAEDASGNVTEVTRDIVYSDPMPPQITLEGKETMYLVVKKDRYKEPGFTAEDNFDGDLTELVTVTGEVDKNTMGTYEIQYTVTDSHQNTTTVTRTVVVREYPELPDMPKGDFAEPVTPEGKVVYLTFDDGPSMYTEELLDILKKYDVKATFFVTGRAAKYPELIKRMAEEGHTVAMHCNLHSYWRIYSSEEEYFNDLKTIQDLIKEYTGQTSTILRFPGGSGNAVSKGYNEGIMSRLTKMVKAMGYRYFDWNVDASDCSDAYTTEEVYNNVIGGMYGKDVSIVLQHDIKGFSVAAVEDIIKWGLENGRTFLPLDTSSPLCEGMLRN